MIVNEILEMVEMKIWKQCHKTEAYFQFRSTEFVAQRQRAVRERERMVYCKLHKLLFPFWFPILLMVICSHNKQLNVALGHWPFFGIENFLVLKSCKFCNSMKLLSDMGENYCFRFNTNTETNPINNHLHGTIMACASDCSWGREFTERENIHFLRLPLSLSRHEHWYYQ